MAVFIELDKLIAELSAMQETYKSDDDSVWEKNKPCFKALAYAQRIALDLPRLEINTVNPDKGAPYDKSE